MIAEDTLVITPTLGTRSTLATTIGSVRDYGGSRVRHVVVCPERKVQAIASAFPGTEVVKEGPGSGIYSALNHVFRRFGGSYKYLAYLNDDDAWLLGYQKLFGIMDENPNVDVAYGRAKMVSVDGQLLKKTPITFRPDSIPALVTHGIIPITQQAALIKAELFFANKGFDERFKLVADTDFWLRSIENGAKFQPFDCLCANYLIQDGQLSSDQASQLEEHIELRYVRQLRPSLGTHLACLAFRLRNSPEYAGRIFQQFLLKRSIGK